MKKKFKALLTLCLLGLFGCAGTVIPGNVTSGTSTGECIRRIPIKMSYKDFRVTKVELEKPRTLKNTGKIYFYRDYIFINEYAQGVHIIDNKNSANPTNVGFIPMRGNFDMATKDNALYLDSYMDLVTLDISQLEKGQVRLVDRNEWTFNVNRFHDGAYALKSDEDSLTIDWKEEKYKCEYTREALMFDTTSPAKLSRSAAAPSTSSGVAGSMARFMIYKNYMYSLMQSDMLITDISNSFKPLPTRIINVGWGIETIFPYQDKIFIGSNSGMFIFDNSNPLKPDKIATYRHVLSCDPVVTDGKYAYVTLRSGQTCRNGVDRLDVIDLSVIEKPKSVAIYPMYNPHGLGISNETLFICDGKQGLKVYDAKDPENLVLVKHYDTMDAYDVIPLKNTLILIGKDGLFQYDYSDAKNIKLISSIQTQ